MVQRIITDDLDLLLNALPPHISSPLRGREDNRELLEIVMDLGRRPEARYPGREVVLAEVEVTPGDIEYVVARIGEFGDDNRAGIERTLHRISCIRNRRGKIVGLLQAPASKLAAVTQAPASQLARVFKAYAEKDAA